MEPDQVKVHVFAGGKLPVRKTPGAAGYDLYWTGKYTSLEAAGRVKLGLGVAIEIPEGKVGLLCLRSSLAGVYSIPNGLGIIDSDYRGELALILNTVGPFYGSSLDSYIKPGDRVCQLLIVDVFTPALVEVSLEAMTKTVRGTGGFGSTGAK